MPRGNEHDGITAWTAYSGDGVMIPLKLEVDRPIKIEIVGACARADIDDTGEIDVLDLLALLGAWGPCVGTCPADTDGDGSVDVVDLLSLLGSWGPCS